MTSDGVSARPEWRELASCRGRDDVNWFPDPSDYKGIARCQVVCRSCPVIVECATHAEKEPERFGVWAGDLRVDGRRVNRRDEAAYKREWRARRRQQVPHQTLTEDESEWLKERYG